MRRTRTRKTPAKTQPPALFAKHVRDTPLDIVLPELLDEYGSYVLEDRAIPALQDGLKPSQRRVLWALHHALHSTPVKNKIKCARAEGATMQFHPHGGTYGTLVGMVEGTPVPLVTGYGNFGSYSRNRPPAAPRYTECGLSWFTLKMLFDPRFEKVMPLIPNYDGSSVEPVYLPSQLPLVLATGAQGIAMATTTVIPSFTIESIYRATMLALRYKKRGYKVPAEKLMRELEFATAYGGEVDTPDEEILKLFQTGTGPINWVCDYETKDNTIHITGLAPGWSFDGKFSKIRELPYVAECVDISEGDRIHIRITFKRMDIEEMESCVDKVLKLLTSKVHHRINVTERYRVDDPLVPTSGADFSPYSIPDLLARWMTYRVKWERMALTVEYNEVKEKIAQNELLMLAHNNLDVIFKMLKQRLKNKVSALAKALDITEEESRYIWSIAVGRLDRLSGDEIKAKLKELRGRLREIRLLHKNPEESIRLHLKANREDLTNPVAYGH